MRRGSEEDKRKGTREKKNVGHKKRERNNGNICIKIRENTM